VRKQIGRNEHIINEVNESIRCRVISRTDHSSIIQPPGGTTAGKGNLLVIVQSVEASFSERRARVKSEQHVVENNLSHDDGVAEHVGGERASSLESSPSLVGRGEDSVRAESAKALPETLVRKEHVVEEFGQTQLLSQSNQARKTASRGQEDGVNDVDNTIVSVVVRRNDTSVIHKEESGRRGGDL